MYPRNDACVFVCVCLCVWVLVKVAVKCIVWLLRGCCRVLWCAVRRGGCCVGWRDVVCEVCVSYQRVVAGVSIWRQVCVFSEARWYSTVRVRLPGGTSKA